MKLAVMQPYIFPYLGYYQLVNAVDLFVFFDDVNYIKKGWINKNNILVNDTAYKFTLPIKDISQNKAINEVELFDYKNWREKFLKTIRFSYKKSPYFAQGFEIVSKILEQPHNYISDVAECSIIEIAKYLNLNTKFEKSSNINYLRTAESGEEKILDICGNCNASVYINPINGKDLYNGENFKKQNITLNFINMDQISYNQFSNENFVPSLSIIDVLMFNDVKTIQLQLNKYILK